MDETSKEFVVRRLAMAEIHGKPPLKKKNTVEEMMKKIVVKKAKCTITSNKKTTAT